MKRVKFIICMALITVLASSMTAFGCTGMYVGKDVSKDGTTIIARSEDQGAGAYNKMFKVQEAESKSGRFFVDTGEGQENFKVPLPKETFKYTYVPDSSDAGDGMYPASCTNEYGVSVVGTISADPGEKYAELDPMVEIGLREAILPGLLCCQIKSAREGVELLAKLTDKYGSQEGNILFFTDQKEAWIFESYGGHTYCAMKMPTDKVAVFGNQFMIGTVDKNDKENYIFSKNLFETLDKAGAVMEDGKYHVSKTVSGSLREEYSNMRNWGGMTLLAPSIAPKEYSDDDFLPLFYSPDKKVSVFDVFKVFRYRYEGTPYDMMDSENDERRPIGVTRSSDVHVIQVYSDLPKDTCNLQWLCMGNAEHSVFVPAFSGINSTLDAYQVDGSPYNEKSAYWTFKKNVPLAASDRQFLGKGVKDFWALQERMMYKEIQKNIPAIKDSYKTGKSSGRSFVTKLSDKMAKEQLDNSNRLFENLLFVATFNTNDRPDNERKIAFVAPTDLEKAAKYKGYKLEVKEGEKANQYKLTKDKVSYTFKTGADTYKMVEDGKKTEVEFAFAAFEDGNKVYVPVDFITGLK